MKRREFLKMSAGGLAFAGVGCATGARSNGGRFSWDVQAPRRAGIDPEGLPHVRAATQNLIDANQLTGAVTAFARNNKLVWHEAQGIRDLATNAPMRHDDMFQMMSSTKVVTTVAVMMMAEQGRLDINHPVSRYIPSFANPRVASAPEGWRRALTDPALKPEIVSQISVTPAAREITIKDLLTHTAGLSTGGPGALVSEAVAAAVPITAETTLSARIPALGGIVLDFEPGSRWSYSGIDGMDVLLRIVEIASGQEAESLLRERVFGPLDMNDTHFNVPEEKRGRLLTVNLRIGDAWRPLPTYFGGTPTRYICGAAGLLSTAHDYLNFETMLLNRGVFNGRRLLRPETVELMATNHVGALFAEAGQQGGPGMGFGLGGAVVLDPALVNDGRGRGTYGWGGALGTVSWSDPENDVAAVYLVQQPATTGARDFARAIKGALV